MKKRKIVIALGGNALGKNVEEQQEAVEHTAKVIVDLEQQGYDLIISRLLPAPERKADMN